MVPTPPSGKSWNRNDLYPHQRHIICKRRQKLACSIIIIKRVRLTWALNEFYMEIGSESVKRPGDGSRSTSLINRLGGRRCVVRPYLRRMERSVSVNSEISHEKVCTRTTSHTHLRNRWRTCFVRTSFPCMWLRMCRLALIAGLAVHRHSFLAAR